MAKRVLPKVLNQDEQELLLKEFNHRYPTSYRNFVMVKMMLDTGLRVSEAINLKVKEIDWMSGKFKVQQGKGKKDRILWMNDDLLEHLKQLRELFLKYDTDYPAPYLFTTLKRKPLQPAYMRNMLNRISKRAGLEKHVSPHMLRHSFATDLYKETKDLLKVKKTLGHSSITTTTIYTHLVDDDVEMAMRNLRKKN